MMQHGSSKDRAVKALAGLFVQYPERGPVDRFRGVREIVENMLYLVRLPEPCNKPDVCAAQTARKVIFG